MPPITTNSATGRFFRTVLPSSSSDQRGDAQRERRRVGAAEAAQEMAHALPEIAVAAAEAEQLGQLRARQEQRDAALEADEHGFGEEVDDGAGARGVGRERERRDDQRRARGERGVARRVAARHLAERRADQQRDRRGDGDGGVARAAEQPEHEPAEQARVEARLGGRPASDASPIPAGSRYAASVTPAMTSPDSHDRS